MKRSSTYLFVVALLVGVFETLSAVWLNAPDRMGQVVAGVFALAFFTGARAIRRGSVAAASVVGVLLSVEVIGLPFYERASVADLLVQLAVTVPCALGVAAWIDVLRHWRRSRVADSPARVPENAR
jgi:hypothetical protein